MSNLPINNFMPMNHNFPLQGQDKPVVDKVHDPMVSNGITDMPLLDHDAGSKDDHATMNTAVLNQIFDMLESLFKAMRNMFTRQGAIPQPMPEAGVLPKVTPQANPGSSVVAGTAEKTPEQADADPKANTGVQLLKDIASKALADAAVMPKPVQNAEPESMENPGNDAENRPEAGMLTKTLTREVPDTLLAKALQNSQTAGINMTVQVINCDHAHPEVNVIRDTSTVDGQTSLLLNTPDTSKVDGQTSLVLNTPDKPKVDGQTSLVLNTPDTSKVDGQTSLVLNTPDTSKVDGQTSLVLNTPDTSKVDGQTSLVLNTPDTSKVDGQTSLVLNTPDTSKVDGQTSLVLSTPDKPEVDGQPPLVLNTPEKTQVDGQTPLALNTPEKPEVDGQPSVVVNKPDTPEVDGETVKISRTPKNLEADTKPGDVQPEVTPGSSPKLKLTSPGPADDSLDHVLLNRSRNRFDNAWGANTDHRARA